MTGLQARRWRSHRPCRRLYRNALQDEYHAEETYLRVLADLGDVLPFYNVVYAEQRHSASLAGLLERRGLAVPASEWNVNNVPRFAIARGRLRRRRRRGDRERRAVRPAARATAPR